jgi:hypothetical protein
MGYNARNDEIRDNVTRMQREWKAQRGALATVRRFNATLSAKGYVWFWPKIAAALTSKHHWLIVGCDSCGCAIFFMLLQNASSSRVERLESYERACRIVWRCAANL